MTPAETVEQRWWQPCANKCIFNSSKYIHFSMASDKRIVCHVNKRPGNNGDALHVQSTVPVPSELSVAVKNVKRFSHNHNLCLYIAESQPQIVKVVVFVQREIFQFRVRLCTGSVGGYRWAHRSLSLYRRRAMRRDTCCDSCTQIKHIIYMRTQTNVRQTSSTSNVHD